jgi:hypothetical protein
MSMSDENGEQGMLVLREQMPLYGRFSLLVSDAFSIRGDRDRVRDPPGLPAKDPA